MFTSPNGYQLIRDEEGLSLQVVNDVGGKQMVGYGHDLLPGESYPNGITLQFAEILLGEDVAKCEIAVNALASQANQNQFDALIDFTYNLGRGALATMLSHGWDQVPEQIVRWDHSGGVVLPGLTARRTKEVELFNS